MRPARGIMTMEINIKLDAKLKMRDGIAELRLTDNVPDSPWYQDGAGKDFFDALCRVDGDGGGFRVRRASGHTAVLVVRDAGIDTGWANEQQA